MVYLIRFIILLLIISLAVMNLFVPALIIGFGYLFWFVGYELALVAILIDGYYQSFYEVPTLTILTILALVLVDLVKPRLLMYTGENEIVS